MIYVMSDIHGEYQKFLKMLNLINFSKDDTMYILGDVIDRGKEGISILQDIIYRPNVKLLLGNHEDMMLKALVHQDMEYYNCWIYNGGVSTMRQYDTLTDNEQRNIVVYLQMCPLYVILDKYILVHAGLDDSLSNTYVNIDQYMRTLDKETLLWNRNLKCRINNYTIIVGHTPTIFQQDIIPMKIWYGDNIIDIDCGACFGNGQLGCLRLDDMKEFYIV